MGRAINEALHKSSIMENSIVMGGKARASIGGTESLGDLESFCGRECVKLRVDVATIHRSVDALTAARRLRACSSPPKWMERPVGSVHLQVRW